MVELQWYHITASAIVGLIFGWVILSMLVSSKISDLESEIISLRAVRSALKEEIFRLDNQSKPKPRKKRSPKKS
jgi:hypothetical protein